MICKQYDVYIENDPEPEKNPIVIAHFPKHSQFDNPNPKERLELCLKPKSCKLKLSVNLNTDAKSFSTNRAEKQAALSKPQTFPTGRVDKNIYTSYKHDKTDTQLFACRAMGNQLICRPVTHVSTMRPDFTHFDLKEEVDANEEVRPVSVKFASTDRQNAPTKAQTQFEDPDEAAEDFKPIDFYPKDSSRTKSERERLFGPRIRVKRDPDLLNTPDRGTTEAGDKIVDIKPKLERIDDSEEQQVSNTTNSSPRKNNLIRQKVKECLMRAKLVSFEEVIGYVRDQQTHPPSQEPLSPTNKDINDALTEFAVLVQGNWAVKSEILYGEPGESQMTDVTGIPISLFNAARDYLLLSFDQSPFISRIEYSKKVRIPDHDVLVLFKQLATFRKEDRKWQFKLPKNVSYLEQYPEIAQRQLTLWKVRRANKMNMF